jgi:inhibitor of cysteine peptidase
MVSKKCRFCNFSVPLALFFVALIIGSTLIFYAYQQKTHPEKVSFSKFKSCDALIEAINKSAQSYGRYYLMGKAVTTGMRAEGLDIDYSKTNIQVAGVDEADIVKTDGEFIYTISGNKLVIAKAYPPEQAEILSETDLGEIQPIEIFIDKDVVLVFGMSYKHVEKEAGSNEKSGEIPEIYPYPYTISLTTAQLWDVSDKSNPNLVRSVDFEGDYLSSRKIESDVYFVVNSYPRYYVLEKGDPIEIIPLYRDRLADDVKKEKEFIPACGCKDVKYFEPIDAQNFITVASISMSDANAEIKKEVIVGSGQNIYASLNNLYIAETNYPVIAFAARPETIVDSEKTIVHKFSMDDGKITYVGYMEAPGWVLNQFSMDEYDTNFRIATTRGFVTRSGIMNSSNNIYIFDSGLNLIGKIEGLAPGEQIYSARFIGDRCYLVTFKKVDPLFVIDLSDPSSPKILGKLKIPGYSDYLHPYDENHLIGIGKEAVETEEGNFAWYQGLKMAIFDVSDVQNPKELHKVVIGDRGTDSEALHDHKAFLFDREKNLLVIPVLLAEIKGDKEKLPPYTYGDYVFQGVYVYTITLENGFDLKGRVTHYETSEPFEKSGYYFGDREYSIRRSLYIDNILYTISQKKIKLNSLDDLNEIKELDITSEVTK